ncbi:MAG: ATP-binding protein [Kineosporiaceae bacterium]
MTEYMETFRVVVLGGARQVGKTTMVLDLLDLPGARYVTLDDAATLARVRDDPSAVLESGGDVIVIDEYQRAGPGLLLAIKAKVDRDSRRGQVLLTGSAGYEASAAVAESLAGRAGRVVVWPLSAGEVLRRRDSFVDDVFTPRRWPGPEAEPLPRADLVDLVLRGGFPEVVTQDLTGRARSRWFADYLAQVVAREAIRPVADVRLERELRQLVHLVAASSPGDPSPAGLASDTGLSRPTVTSYLALLDALHVTHSVPAWAVSATTRARRRPKTVMVDSGLAAHLAGLGPEAFGPAADGVAAGRLLETYVIGEVARQCGWAERDVDLLHYRDREGREIDIVLEDRRTGEIVGIEVKLTSNPTTRHVRWLAWLRDLRPQSFVAGVLVHAGPQTLPMGERLWAVPVSRLWTASPRERGRERARIDQRSRHLGLRTDVSEVAETLDLLEGPDHR